MELVSSLKDQGQVTIATSLNNDQNSTENTTPFFKRLNKNLDTIRNWKVTLTNGAISSVIVFLFNFGFVLWAVPRHGLENGSRGTLYEGNCDKARKMSTALHLVINLLGTALLSASNYAMACYPRSR